MYFVPSSSRNSAVLQMVSMSPVQQTAAGGLTEQHVDWKECRAGCVETGTLMPRLTVTGPVTLYNSPNLSEGHPLILLSLLA